MSTFHQPGRGRLTVFALAALAPAAVFAQPAAARVAPAVPAPAYRLAFSGELARGNARWGTELAGISGVGGRVQVLPWLGVGLSYFRLAAPNNEGFDRFAFDALEVFSAWHPVVGRWFDPFVQVGALGVVGTNGGYMGLETSSRLGLEGMAGVDFVALPFAVGLHARSGFTNRAWAMAGLHLELRI